ncbi:MAG: hypothetical protein ACK5NG_10640 [Chthoniobacterales bacterium]
MARTAMGISGRSGRLVAPPSPLLVMKIKIEKYNQRNWAIYDSENNLIVVTVYKKGALRIAELLAALPHKPLSESANQK